MAKPRLTRAQVLDAAIAILDAEGPAALTYRRLAADLAAGPGSLYWHVENKDELLALSLDVVLGELGEPFAPAGDDGWGARLRAGLLALWTALRRHPWAAEPAIKAAERSPSMLRFWDGAAGLLFSAGLGAEDVTYALATLRTFVIGNSLQNAVWHAYDGDDARAHDAAVERARSRFDELTLDDYPAFGRLVGVLADHDELTQFVRGLDLILAGLGALVVGGPAR